MVLDFNNRKEDYFSFSFAKGVNKPMLYDYLKLADSESLFTVEKELREKTKLITEKLSGITDIKSSFIIDDIISVDFSRDEPSKIRNIIDDFLMKSKFKKHKSLLLWVPLLQDHFWCNNPVHSKRMPKKASAYTIKPKGGGSWKSEILLTAQVLKPRRKAATVDLTRLVAKPVSFATTTTNFMSSNSWFIPETDAMTVDYIAAADPVEKVIEPDQIPEPIDYAEVRGLRLAEFIVQTNGDAAGIPLGYVKIIDRGENNSRFLTFDLYDSWRNELLKREAKKEGFGWYIEEGFNNKLNSGGN